jgi:cell division protein FtsZ
MIELMVDEQQQAATNNSPSIKVLGVGGAGGNTVNSLVESGCVGVTCLAANTDGQALEISKAVQKIQLGVKATKGLGSGANPEIGKHAAEEDLDKIMESLSGADIVFLTAGMGGGTGSGALPVIARALREEGILTIALVTKPFLFEGKRRAQIANQAIELLKKEVDSLIIIPNQRLLDIVDQKVSMIQAFAMINDMLSQSVRGIADIIIKPGYINVDFADVKAIMKGMGLAIMGTGMATGDERAKYAALTAISSPLLENLSIRGARGVLLNITGSSNLRLHEISDAASIVYEQAAEDAHIILGSVIDESMGDQVLVTIIATGFEQPQEEITAQVKPAVMEKPLEEAKEVLHVAKEAIVQPAMVKLDATGFTDELDEPTFLRRQQQSVEKSE